MLDANKRLALMLEGEKRKYSKKPANQRSSDLQILSEIDAQIVPLFEATIEDLPTNKLTLLGLVEFTQAIDDRVAELGHRDLVDNERISKAKAYFSDDDTTIETVTVKNDAGQTWVELYGQLRADVWKIILSKIPV